MENRKWTWSQISDLNLSEMLDVRHHLESHSMMAKYIEVVVSYLKGDTQTLVRLQTGLESQMDDDEARFLAILCTVRLQIRRHTIDIAALKKLEATKAFHPALEGEKHFVIAYAYELLDDNLNCKMHFEKAYRLLNSHQVPRKAIKAFHNLIAVEGRINPEKILLSDYHLVFRKAKRLNELAIAGMALLNMAREYELIGASEVALKYCVRALRYMKDHMGSVDYFLALAQKSSILFRLNRRVEAQLAFDEARVCRFPEVHAALAAIEAIHLDADPSRSNAGHLDMGWKMLMEQSKQGVVNLTPTENRLIELLSTGEKDKFEIMASLYGDKLDRAVMENRLKVLLTRLRKKLPQLIVFVGGKYRIADSILLNATGF